MPRIVLLLGIALVGAILFGCAPKVVPASPVEEKPAEVAAPVAKEGWEIEWEKTLAEAKKEGQVMLYSTAGGHTMMAITKGFKDRHGIDVHYITGRGGEISAKLMSERRAGLFLADVYVGGATTLITHMKPAGLLEPILPVLILPEVKDEKIWYGGQLPFVDKDKKILAFMAYPATDLAINTELVKEEIKSFKALLDPKWRGKILMNDPTIAGAGLGWFGRYYAKEGYGDDYMKKLVENKPTILRDERLQLDWLAKGRYALVINPKSEVVAEYVRAWAPVKSVIMDMPVYSAGTGHVSMINRAPHPNAARVYINWLLTREGQTIWTKSMLRQSAREDVPTEDFLPPEERRQPGVVYIRESDEEALLRRPMDAEHAKEIFADLLK